VRLLPLLLLLVACNQGTDSDSTSPTTSKAEPLRYECPVESIPMQDGYPLILDCDDTVCLTATPQFYLPEQRVDVRCTRQYLLVRWMR